MILHRSPNGVLSTNGLSVVLRVRPNMHVSQRASLEAFRAGKLDAAILEAFDLRTLAEALARDVIGQRSLPIRRSTLGEHADRPSVQRVWSFGRGDPRAVWIRGRAVSAMADGERYDASFDEYLAAGFPVALSDALGGDVVDAVRAAVLALHPLPCLCNTGAETIEQHGTLETLVSKSDPRAPVDVRAAVGSCTVCHTGWTFEAGGDSHYDYHYSAREFAPRVGFSDEEVDQILSGIRSGIQVVVGGSRCHTTYRARDGGSGELVAEDFDEGATTETSCSESSIVADAKVRAVIADDPENFLDVLRSPLRIRLGDALLDATSSTTSTGSQEAARTCFGELLAFGECLTRSDLLEAVLAWPEEKPSHDMLTEMTKDTTGLDAYHAVMSALGYGYGRESAAVGQFGLRFFSALFEMLGEREMPRLRRYRASFHAMVGDLAAALEDLEWERAHQLEDDPDVPYLQREIEDLRRRFTSAPSASRSSC